MGSRVWLTSTVMGLGMTTEGARLRVLGRFELHVDGRRHDVPWQAQRVLGFVAVNGAVQSRTTVAGTLWGDVSQRRAQANLRNAVWRIRQLGDRVLRCGRDVIGLDGAVTLDLHDAQRRAHTLLHGVGDVGDRDIEVLDDDLLPEWDEPWLLIERERQRQLRMHALETLSAALVRAGRYPQAITAALAAVRAEPLRESSQRALIAAHLAEGNISEAMRQLTVYRTLLRVELGITPSGPLEAMVATALSG